VTPNAHVGRYRKSFMRAIAEPGVGPRALTCQSSWVRCAESEDGRWLRRCLQTGWA
jgi:hypothetical protein